jgi:rubrerythrin
VNKVIALELWSLSLKDALDLAILIEEEAKDRYGEFAHQMATHHNEQAARFFRFMIDVEASHEHALLERRRRLFGKEPSSVRREMLFDVEAPEYGEVRATMGERDALEAALRAEKKAYAFFDAAARLAVNKEVAELFFVLRDEEADHETHVRGRIGDLPPQPTITAEDVDDGPVAH